VKTTESTENVGREIGVSRRFPIEQGRILDAGAVVYARTHIIETRGIFLPEASRTPEVIAERFEEMSSLADSETPSNAIAQATKFADRALAVSRRLA
jgi:hypothetical protein